MWRPWSSSVCCALLLTCLACNDSSDVPGGTRADAGPAAGSGGESDAGGTGGDSGQAYAAGRGGGGSGSGSGGRGGAGGTGGVDVEPAQCLPDPSDFTPCGGDIVGQWRIASFCRDSGLEDLRDTFKCQALTQDFNVDYRRIAEFKDNGDYLTASSTDVTQNVKIPKSCFDGASTDCDEALKAYTSDDEDDGWSLSAADSGDSCLLDAAYHATQKVTGSYEVSGSTVTVRDGDGPDASDYCVDGDKLTIRTEDSASGQVTWGVFTRE